MSASVIACRVSSPLVVSSSWLPPLAHSPPRPSSLLASWSDGAEERRRLQLRLLATSIPVPGCCRSRIRVWGFRPHFNQGLGVKKELGKNSRSCGVGRASGLGLAGRIEAVVWV